MPERILGVGVAGTGAFARAQHLPNLARIPVARLVALWNRSEPRLVETSQRWPAELATTDYAAFLAHPGLDVVVIAAGDAVQAELATRAMLAGKHVYCEKPLAETAASGAAVVAAQRASGCRLAVGFNRRHAPACRRAKALLTGKPGPWTATARFIDDACWRWGKDLPPGSLIVHDLCHLFDLLRWLSGDEITAVSCWSARPDDDLVQVRLAGGTVASLHLSGHGSNDMPKERLEIIAGRGGLVIDEFAELRTFGWADAPAVELFAGHSHPDREFGPRLLYGKLGLEGVLAIRRSAQELRWKLERGELVGGDADEARVYLSRLLATFTVDKGWRDSLAAFLYGVIANEPTDHAGAADALIANAAARAAVASRDCGGALVAIDPTG